MIFQYFLKVFLNVASVNLVLLSFKMYVYHLLQNEVFK